MRKIAVFAALALAVGCKKVDETPDYTLRDTYLESQCRFFVTGECADNMSTNCGGAITFDTVDDCTQLLRFGLAGCTGYNDALIENETTVQACIDQLDGFDCANDLACDGDPETTNITTSGPCGEVDDFLNALCPEDTGDTGA